jgi:cytoskeleton protein RodZ
VQEISVALRIKPQYLSALEDDKYSNLPGAAYAMGFIRTYADYLGLDPQKMINEYKAIEGAAAERSAANEPDENTLIENPIINSTHFILLGAFLFLGMFVAYLFNSRADDDGAPAAYSAQQAQESPAQNDAAEPAPLEPVPLEPEIIERPNFTPAPAATFEGEPEALKPVPETAAETLPLPQISAPAEAMPGEPRASTEYGNASDSRIKIVAKGRVWIKLKRGGLFKYDEDADDNDAGTGERVFEGILEPGDSYHVPDEDDQYLSVGNAQFIDIHADGKIAPAVSDRPISRHNIEMDARKLESGTAYVRNRVAE